MRRTEGENNYQKTQQDIRFKWFKSKNLHQASDKISK